MYTFENICRRACGKYYIGVCMVISQLLVNFIPDHATKHRHFIVSNFRKTFHLFLEYGELLALPILQITFKLPVKISMHLVSRAYHCVSTYLYFSVSPLPSHSLPPSCKCVMTCYVSRNCIFTSGYGLVLLIPRNRLPFLDEFPRENQSLYVHVFHVKMMVRRMP